VLCAECVYMCVRKTESSIIKEKFIQHHNNAWKTACERRRLSNVKENPKQHNVWVEGYLSDGNLHNFFMLHLNKSHWTYIHFLIPS
jgi:hypothetical protein